MMKMMPKTRIQGLESGMGAGWNSGLVAMTVMYMTVDQFSIEDIWGRGGGIQEVAGHVRGVSEVVDHGGEVKAVMVCEWGVRVVMGHGGG